MVGKLTNILIDGRAIKVPVGYTIMQACLSIGIDIPKFCYHDKLLIAGNCRMCLVEVSGIKKLVASCAAHVAENTWVQTNSARVRLARQNVLEFLLSNHPLDCPICDQGGECDLQDITMLFGADRGRFYEHQKRSVLNKDFGPLIRTSMNRCIHCTRCVRFLSMSSGLSVLGTMGRGVSTEISLYINQFITDELSGNITDLCPVGALTSKPYSFKARPWELTSLCSVDVFDSMNSSLVFEVMANKICRVLPYTNDALNECWLTNKARYAYDGLFSQRLNSCLLRTSLKFFSKLISHSTSTRIQKMKFVVFVKLPWASGFQFFLKKLFSDTTWSFSVFIGNSVDIESLLSAKFFVSALGSENFLCDVFGEANYGFNSPLASDFSYLYLFNTSLSNLSRLPSFCLLLSSNLRFEVPLLNLRLTNLVSNYNINIYKIGGSALYSAHKTTIISTNALTFFYIAEFKHPFCKNFYLANFAYRPFLLSALLPVNQCGIFNFSYVVVDFIRRLLRVRVFNFFSSMQLAEFNFFGFVLQYSAHIHFFDGGVDNGVLKFKTFGTLPMTSSGLLNCNIAYSVGFTEKLFLKKRSNLFLVFQGTHGGPSQRYSDLIFPAVTHVEKVGAYRNLVGIVQKSNLIVDYAFGARSDFLIFRTLLDAVWSYKAINFFRLAFKNAVLFNFWLTLANEFFLNRAFDRFAAIFDGWTSLEILVARHKPLAINKFFYYDAVYNANFKSKFFGAAENFNNWLVLTKIFTNLFASSSVNYYSDDSALFLRMSKSMTLCSNLFLKKNLSFSPVYF